MYIAANGPYPSSVCCDEAGLLSLRSGYDDGGGSSCTASRLAMDSVIVEGEEEEGGEGGAGERDDCRRFSVRFSPQNRVLEFYNDAK